MHTNINNIFPEPITQLPKADIPIKGLTAYLSQADTHQILYMQFQHTTELAEHSHADQIGFILEGKIDLVIDNKTYTYSKGDRYHIPAAVKHSAKIYAGYADITIFMQADRYKIKS